MRDDPEDDEEQVYQLIDEDEASNQAVGSDYNSTRSTTSRRRGRDKSVIRSKKPKRSQSGAAVTASGQRGRDKSVASTKKTKRSQSRAADTAFTLVLTPDEQERVDGLSYKKKEAALLEIATASAQPSVRVFHLRFTRLTSLLRRLHAWSVLTRTRCAR